MERVVVFREQKAPVLDFHWIPLRLDWRPLPLSHTYLPFRLVSPQALNHQPPAENTFHHIRSVNTLMNPSSLNLIIHIP